MTILTLVPRERTVFARERATLAVLAFSQHAQHVGLVMAARTSADGVVELSVRQLETITGFKTDCVRRAVEELCKVRVKERLRIDGTFVHEWRVTNGTPAGTLLLRDERAGCRYAWNMKRVDELVAIVQSRHELDEHLRSIIEEAPNHGTSWFRESENAAPQPAIEQAIWLRAARRARDESRRYRVPGGRSSAPIFGQPKDWTALVEYLRAEHTRSGLELDEIAFVACATFYADSGPVDRECPDGKLVAKGHPLSFLPGELPRLEARIRAAFARRSGDVEPAQLGSLDARKAGTPPPLAEHAAHARELLRAAGGVS